MDSPLSASSQTWRGAWGQLGYSKKQGISKVLPSLSSLRPRRQRNDYGAEFELWTRIDLCGRIASLKTFRAYMDFQWEIENRGTVSVPTLIWPLDHVFERRYERRGLVLRKLPREDIFFGEFHKHRWPAFRVKGNDPLPIGPNRDFDDAFDPRRTRHDRIERHLPRNDQRKFLIHLLSKGCERQHST